ncbi:MAG: ribonuclease HII [marine bacterium B5-7]|nr:MAG: ribonuclease HII [marine bacterium B5-7]
MTIIVGIDEAGRGPLAGPVVAGAVILDPNHPIDGLTDSKKLSEKRREALYAQITEHALAWAVGYATPQEIDEINILQATFRAMQRAVANLTIAPDLALIDGNRCPADLPCESRAIIKGDLTEPAISAASIIAKVTRDRDLYALHEQHPEYGFDRHKAYPTKAHYAAIEQFGILPIHRRSFLKKILVST